MLGLTTEQNSTTFPTHEETSHNSNIRERERERERESFDVAFWAFRFFV